MKRKMVLAFAVVLLLSFASCGKKMGQLPSNLFKVEQSPLEVKGGKVETVVEGSFPAKYFNKNAIVTVTPVLKYNGTELRGESQKFQGEKVAKGFKVINSKEGGEFIIPVNFDYVPDMKKSELYLDFELQVKDKVLSTIPQIKVADGVIATAYLIDLTAAEIAPALAADGFQRVTQEIQEAEIKFLIQQANLRSKETNKKEVKALIAALKEVRKDKNKEIVKLNVSGIASPDGPYILNEKLAKRRSKVAADFMSRELRKQRIKTELNVETIAEDWIGFQNLVEKSDLAEKEAILRIVANYTDIDVREKEIKNLAVAYAILAKEILPELRRSILQVVVEVQGKTDEEILALFKEDASALTNEELLYTASLVQTAEEKAEVYQVTITAFPEDFRAYNNLAALKLADNAEEAEQLIAKAASLVPSSADVNYNLALIAASKGDVEQAAEHFAAAEGTTANLAKANASLQVLKGDYAQAKSAFVGDASNNAAVLEIVSGNYAEAQDILNKIEKPNAKSAYLAAIIGARTNDLAAVVANLKLAIQKDRSYLEKAKNDIEFAKLLTSPEVLSILQ